MTKTTAILIKENAMDEDNLRQHYLGLLAENGIPEEDIIVLPLMYNQPTKVAAKTAKAYLDKLRSKIPATVDKLIIADAPYFKIVTKHVKISSTYGATVPGKYTNYEDYTCVYIPNYKSLFKQPENQKLIEIGIQKIGTKSTTFHIDSAQYALEFNQDHPLYDQLYQYDELTLDIETTGLTLEDRIITASFAWTMHEGVAIDVDVNGYIHLKRFLETYQGRLIFHNALFDCKLLIRQLWMDGPQDFIGMNKGLKYFQNVDDTMLLAYLAKNATTPIDLGLKECALEFLGHYAIDISDISKHPRSVVLEYNLKDNLGTMYLWNKYHEYTESETYRVIFRPSIPLLLKCMIVGLPLNNDRVHEIHKVFTAKKEVLLQQIQSNTHVQKVTLALQHAACEKKNASLKKLRKTLDDFKHIRFNPNSPLQLAKLFFEQLDLPILDTTKTGAPSTGAEILTDLKNHTSDPDVQEVLDNVCEYLEIVKIDGTFIKAFMEEKDFLHGNLKLGGTQSGRLSSNSPNLTNLPAHGTMGKLVKSCVEAPDGVTKINHELLSQIINSA